MVTYWAVFFMVIGSMVYGMMAHYRINAVEARIAELERVSELRNLRLKAMQQEIVNLTEMRIKAEERAQRGRG